MKTRTIWITTIISLLLLSACTQPVNVTSWLEPSRDMLKEIFALLQNDAPAEEAAKALETATLVNVVEAMGEDTAVPEGTAILPTEAAATEGPAAGEPVTASGEPAGRILYTCQVDNTYGHDQICMINADGSGFRQLTNDLLHQHFYPSWAPDGNSFVFVGSHSGDPKIYEMDLQGNMHIVGNIAGELYAPMVSPDGLRIIFTRHVSDTEQYISVMDRDGSNLLDLVDYYDSKDPVWSQDGSKVLFTSREDNQAGIYTMNAGGTTIQKVEALSGLDGRPDWSLDYAIATYSGSKDAHDREIIVMEVGEDPVTVTSGGDNLSPSFSPDGQWVAFMSYRDHFWEADGCEIYIMRKDGTDIRRLTDNTYCDYQPRWGK
ncbi:MAG: TolB protein [Chloroflexota bacterium]|nr:TolB protein [Chloroflexota bacterium]